MDRTEKLKAAQSRADTLLNQIKMLCILNKLNLTVYNGHIAFVDQELKTIVAEWVPKYKMSDIPKKAEDGVQ